MTLSAVAQWADPDHGRYVKMITRAGVLTALRLRRDAAHGGRADAPVRAGGELPADRSVLLRFDGPDYDAGARADAFAPAPPSARATA